MTRIGAIVLAAGRSTRMRGENKLTASLRGKPLLAHAIEALHADSIDDIVVVTGHDAPAIRDALRAYELRFAQNADHESGMGSSIACGVENLQASGRARGVDGVLVCLGDMPEICASVLEALRSAFVDADSIVVPIGVGRRGHPVLFGAGHFAALRALRGDRGARSVLEDRSESVIEVECEDPGIHRDIDTRGELDVPRSGPTPGPPDAHSNRPR